MKSINIDINPKFKACLQFIKKKKGHLFITGEAGAGKSTLLQHIQSENPNFVFLATTGIAAIHIKGQTIHRFFNFPVHVTTDKIIQKEIVPKQKRIYQKLTTLIIDEVSMLRADLLDCIDVFLKKYRKEPLKAFGGVNLIFVGDLYQLPPVVTEEEKEIFVNYYTSPYFFSAKVFNNIKLNTIELQKNYRQKDNHFIQLLNAIRRNQFTENDLKQLNSRYQKPDLNDDFLLHLTTTNQKAQDINLSQLDKIDNPLITATAEIIGEFKEKDYPTDEHFKFKLNSQIMLLTNEASGKWFNGSMGKIIEFKQDEQLQHYLKIQLENQTIISVYPYTWEVYKFALQKKKIVSEPVGSFTQFPVKLAWAITIHKSQGKTFDQIVIDTDNKVFAHGQIYVGLSRCRELSGIYLQQLIQARDVKVDPAIQYFFKPKTTLKSEINNRNTTNTLNMKATPLKAPIKQEWVDLINSTLNNKGKLLLHYQTLNTPSSLSSKPFKNTNYIITPQKLTTQILWGQCLKSQQNKQFKLSKITKIYTLSNLN